MVVLNLSKPAAGANGGASHVRALSGDHDSGPPAPGFYIPASSIPLFPRE